LTPATIFKEISTPSRQGALAKGAEITRTHKDYRFRKTN
jgi:hypothetical protein